MISPRFYFVEELLVDLLEEAPLRKKTFYSRLIPIAINNFILERVKAAEIADRKPIRIVLIRMGLRNFVFDDLSELSRSYNM